jgi:hypothetical protein
MWIGDNRQNVVKELCQVLNIIHPDLHPNEEDGIIYYDRVALVTMVNSIEYIDEDFGVRKPVSGIDELIFGISKCLERDYMFAWLRTVSHNKSFWTKMSSKIGNLLQIPYNKFDTLCQHAENFLEYLFTSPEDNQEYYTPSDALPTINPWTDNQKVVSNYALEHTLQFTTRSNGKK